jgi:hypothetical protein
MFFSIIRLLAFLLINQRVKALIDFSYFFSFYISIRKNKENEIGDVMSENDEFDPLFTPIRKVIKIREFLVLDKEIDGKTNYIIKPYNSSKEEAMEALAFLKEEISSFNELSPIQKIEFCKNQRKLIKLYLKLLNQK